MSIAARYHRSGARAPDLFTTAPSEAGAWRCVGGPSRCRVPGQCARDRRFCNIFRAKHLRCASRGTKNALHLGMYRRPVLLVSAMIALSAAGAGQAEAQGAGSIQATVTVVDVNVSASTTFSAVQVASSLHRTGTARRDLVNATLLAEARMDASIPAASAEPPRMLRAPRAPAPGPSHMVSVIYW